VWDIHSPRVPTVPELVDKLTTAVAAFPRERLWVNPDCGLKTRDYPEVRASLANLVSAAHRVREQE
jgi:5-methyltetrahydropteroyltriglutamate--homocysteine methyltransferase